MVRATAVADRCTLLPSPSTSFLLPPLLLVRRGGPGTRERMPRDREEKETRRERPGWRGIERITEWNGEEKRRKGEGGEGRGGRGAFHVTAIINGYIPTLSHETILVTREREKGGGGERREGEGRGFE